MERVKSNSLLKSLAHPHLCAPPHFHSLYRHIMLARRALLARLASVSPTCASHAVVATAQGSSVPSVSGFASGFASMPATAETERLHAKEGKVLHPDLIAENFRKCQYAVRGELYLRAEELRQQGREIIFTNGVLRALVLGLVRISTPTIP